MKLITPKPCCLIRHLGRCLAVLSLATVGRSTPTLPAWLPISEEPYWALDTVRPWVIVSEPVPIDPTNESALADELPRPSTVTAPRLPAVAPIKRLVLALQPPAGSDSKGATVKVANGWGVVTLGTDSTSVGTLNMGGDAATVTTGDGIGMVQFNSNADFGWPYYFTNPGTVSGGAIAITGGTQVVNTAGCNVLGGASSYIGSTPIDGGAWEIAAGASSDGSAVLQPSSGGSSIDLASATNAGDAANKGRTAVSGAAANFEVGESFTQTTGSMLPGNAGTFDPGGMVVDGGVLGGVATVMGNADVNGGVLRESDLGFDPTAIVAIDDADVGFDFMAGANPASAEKGGLFGLEISTDASDFSAVFKGESFSLDIPVDSINGFDPTPERLTLRGRGVETPDASGTWVSLLIGVIGLAGLVKFRRPGLRGIASSRIYRSTER